MNWKSNLRNQTPPSHVTVINRTTESVKSVKLQRKTYWRWKMRKKTEKLSFNLYLYLFVIITLLVNQSLFMQRASLLLLFFCTRSFSYLKACEGSENRETYTETDCFKLHKFSTILLRWINLTIYNLPRHTSLFYD